jgi:hypothetical protein
MADDSKPTPAQLAALKAQKAEADALAIDQE